MHSLAYYDLSKNAWYQTLQQFDNRKFFGRLPRFIVANIFTVALKWTSLQKQYTYSILPS
jgi:hypothetical protein